MKYILIGDRIYQITEMDYNTYLSINFVTRNYYILNHYSPYLTIENL